MSNVNDPNETAKNSPQFPPTAEERTVALLEAISARLSSFDARFELIEKHLENLDLDVPPYIDADTGVREEVSYAEPSLEPLSPQYALRCDGRLLLSTHALESVDLSDRETFTGIVLSEAEASDAFDRMADAFEDAAAHSAGWLRKRAKKGDRG